MRFVGGDLGKGWTREESARHPGRMTICDPVLGPRFEAAIGDALRLHATQPRKGTRIPYAGHLLGVAGLVIDDGGDEDEAIAAILHDAAEDQGGLKTLRWIRERFQAG